MTAAPIPPLDAPVRTPRTGGYDRFGVPQDSMAGQVATAPPLRPAAARPVAVLPGRRSVLLAMCLAALLGPIGLLYSSRLGALVTATLYFVITLPFVAFWPEWMLWTAVPTFMLSIVWAFVASVAHNAKRGLLARLMRLAQ